MHKSNTRGGLILIAIGLLAALSAHSQVVGTVTVQPDHVATREDAPVKFNPLANDSGPIDPTSLTIILPVRSGTAAVDSATGEVTYTPRKGFNGTDTFTYQACDASGTSCRIADATISVAMWGDYPLLYNRILNGEAADFWRNNVQGTAEERLPLQGTPCALSPNRQWVACGLTVFEAEHPEIRVTAKPDPPDSVRLIGGIRAIAWNPSSPQVVIESSDAISSAQILTYTVPLIGGVVNPLGEAKLGAVTYSEGNATIGVQCREPSWGISGILCVGSEPVTPPQPPRWGLLLVDPGSKPVFQLEDTLAAEPEESRDGKVLYLSGGRLAVMKDVRAGTGGSTILYFGYGARSPTWSPDGRKIALVPFDQSGGASQIVMINADPTNPNPTAFEPPVRRQYGGSIDFLQWDPHSVQPPPLPTRAGGDLLFVRSYATTESQYMLSSGFSFLHRSGADGSADLDFLGEPGQVYPNPAQAYFDISGARVTGAVDARWSPDGARIAYVPAFVRRLAPSGSFFETVAGFVVMNADGSGKTLLTPLPGVYARITSLDWSPDSQRIVFAGAEDIGIPNGANHKLWTMNADGTDVRVLADLGFADVGNGNLGPINIRNPSWSPDGAWIAFTAAAQTDFDHTRYIVPADASGPPILIANLPGQLDERLAWSPDGSKVAYSQAGYIFAADFQAAPPYLANSRQVTPNVPIGWTPSAISPVWSPDGQNIAFLAVSGPNKVGIFAIGIDGTFTMLVLDIPGVGSAIALTDWRRNAAQNNTSVGSPTVTAGPFTLRFTSVTRAGATLVTASPYGPPPPTGFTPGDPVVPGDPVSYFDINSTAVFSGVIEVCLDYGGVTYANPAAVRLLHFVNDGWVDTTTSNNAATHTVCGNVNSFSPFAAMESNGGSGTTAPTITPNVSGALGSGGWYTSDVTVNWTVTDPSSLIASQTGCGSTVINTDTPGTSLTCTANGAGGPWSNTVNIKRDGTAPVAAATASPVANGAGWNRADVTVQFTGTDDTSGIASCATDQLLSAEGTGQSASGTCTDRAGNVSASASVTGINIDKTSPTAAASASPSPNGAGWNTTPVTVSFTATDTLSGVAPDGCDAAVTLSSDGGNQSASGTCRDRAGNAATATANAIRIDRTPPTAAANASPSANVNGWNSTDVIVSFDGTDSLSGSGIDGCSPSTLLSAEGTGLSASGTCTDVAGNTSASATASGINIDKTAPAITINTPPAGASYPAGSTVTANYACSDGRSGISSCSGPVANGASIDTAIAGAKNFPVTAADLAGNTATVGTVYTVTTTGSDTTAPAIAALVQGTLGDNGWYTSNVSVVWQVTDAESAITAQQGCTSSTVTSDTAGTTFACTATSAGGTNSRSITVKRDATKPLVAVLSPLAGVTYPRGSRIPALYGCADLKSGNAQCVGTVAVGTSIDTATAGAKTLSVAGRDRAGNTRTVTVNYRVR